MDDAAERFETLQAKLVPLWKTLAAFSDDEQTIVVVPSLSIDVPFLKGSLLQAYEERFLFLLLLLRQPRARLVYVTSQSILPTVVDYYLSLLPGVIPSHARGRLHLVSADDDSPRPLTDKLLERPHLLDYLRSLIADPDRAHLVPFNTTWAERDLALALGIPIYGADPKLLPLGTKTGGRRLFRQEGVPCPEGVEDVRSPEDIAEAIREIRGRRPETTAVLVKLNEGVSGMGNATILLDELPASGSAEEAGALRDRVLSLECESDLVTVGEYLQLLSAGGGVVEQRLIGTEIRSPSVQMRVTPLGELEILSTHDQMLGGPGGQIYFGARFPADPGYAVAITHEAEKIGRRLALEGVLGRFAVDFVTVRNRSGGWDAYAIELNLRKGGTTHPFLTLQFLTDGAYDAATATFLAPNDTPKHFVASDHVESQAYCGLIPDDLFDIAIRHHLHFDQARQTGVVFHMLAALEDRGRFGLTAVEDSAEAALWLYERTVATVDAETA